MRYAASSPALLAWMKKLNTGKAYHEQVCPFGFLLVYQARTGIFAMPAAAVHETQKRGRPRKTPKPKPIAPYNSDPVHALSSVFDRETGRSVGINELKTYAEVLAQYHVSPEAKFLNGQYLDRGRTERRHVVATGFHLIGKEANRVGESGESDPILSGVTEFGFAN
jgi:hypothetical protein